MKKAPAASVASSSAGGTMLRVSGAADRFHRVNNMNSSRSRSESPKILPSQNAAAAAAAKERDPNNSVRGHGSNDLKQSPSGIYPPTRGNAPDLQNIDRAEGGLPKITGRGLHMPPEILGRAEDADSKGTENNTSSTQDSTSNKKKPAALADLNKASRRRSFLAVKAIKSSAATKAVKAAVKAAVTGATSPSNNMLEGNIALNSSMFTTIIYGGMEVVFSYVISHQAIAGVCSRTNFLFQKLNLSSKAPVVSITSNSSSGMLIVAHQDGIIQTYVPIKTDPINFGVSKSQQRPKSVFGRFRWIDGVILNAAEVFYNLSGEETVKFCDRRQGRPGELVDISSSYDCKLLVAHRRQLAVFDAFPLQEYDENRDFKISTAATLLWTTILPSRVVSAKMSGDGQALVAVIDRPNSKRNYGAMTFLHDKDDGSIGPTGSVPTASIGMVFKPGPFLKHAKPITRLSFRGLGHVTPSANPEKQQGNDLLLTYCEGDSTARIFNQNSWRQLMLWTAPPCSRADWIRGSSAFSLGDLESQLKSSKGRGARNGKSRPNSVSSGLSNATGSISSGLQPPGGFRTAGSGSPTSDAGAWIAEITFRGAYPALRLSRLSYMKRSNDDSQPAHFESIAAILPAGSIIAESVLNADDMGLSIQGVWPAWNPWLSEPSSDASDNGLGGSAMKFLGLSSVPPPGKSQGTFGEYYAGGTHSPPTELRLVASHPDNGNIVLMDFPLWGEDDFGAMELGSPIRHVLALGAVCSLRNEKLKNSSIVASMDYESSRLCAEIKSKGRSISLFWRKEGCMSPYSTEWRDENAAFSPQHKDTIDPAIPDLLHDLSLVHVPISLPPLKLPRDTASRNEDTVIAIKWWPDDSFGGPPLLVAITKSRSIIVYEIPPPLYALEPSMPNFDSSNQPSSVASGSSLYDNSVAEDGSDYEDTRKEYEVLVTPHPDFGLGLRLESPMDGLPAIAGSFKKNPLNDGILPAEKTGMIQLGDELLNVNGVNLENKTFDDIIATVRHVGADLGPGKPLNMKFRPVPFDRSRKNSAVVHESFSVRSNDRSLHNEKTADGTLKHANSQDTASLAAMLYSSSAEAQQEFGRVIAVLTKAITSVDGDDFADRFIVLPWNSGLGTSSSRKLRAAALIVHAYSNKMKVMRVELPAKAGLDKALELDLGVIDLLERNDNKDGNDEPIVIRKIMCTESSCDRWCFVISDSIGGLTLLYLELKKKESHVKEGPLFEMSHEQYRIIDVGTDLRHFRVHSQCTNVLATIDENQSPLRSIKVWHSRPDASSRHIQAKDAVKDNNFDRDFYESTITVEPSEPNSELVDFCFLKTGYLEAFPTIVAFLTSEAIVYQRRGCNKKWTPVVRISYPAIFTSSWRSDFSNTFGRVSENMPLDAYPHLLRLIRATLPSYDEKNHVLSDWHPETLFTHICTEAKGAKFALRGDIKRIFLWIHDKIDGSLDDNLSSDVPLLVAPLASWLTESNDSCDENKRETQSAASLMASLTIANSKSTSGPDRDDQKLKRLYAILQSAVSSSSNTIGMDDSIPGFLTSMNASEMIVLRAILNVVMNPPKYGVLDIQGQLILTIYSIHKEIKKEVDDIDKGKKSTSNFSMQGIYVKRLTNAESSEKKLHPQNASAGCLAALLSDYQGLIIDTIRQPGQKLDWSEVRNLRIPFWIRSDEKLRQLSEEIGQTMYRQTKDILQSAIFFIIAGKKRTLMNLAAADSSLSGRKFHKFLTTYDFSSKRGRVAAEKNAFSLLRKNQYESASAFFLLAEPPMLKSAVETIATKMEDLDLAFLVARVVGNSPSSSDPTTRRGFGGTFGGGGGFAGSRPLPSEATKDKDSFKDWKRNLGVVAKSLILDRVLPSVRNDTCLSSVQLLWLGRIDEASNWLTGLIDSSGKNVPHFVEEVSLPQLRSLSAAAAKRRDSTISTVNSFINLVSGPILLKMMEANRRTRLASTLAVSRSLISAGIEVPALRSLMQYMNETDFQEDQKSNTPSTSKRESQESAPTSSIFDSFDVAPKQKAMQPNSVSDTTSTSIFHSFDTPHMMKPKIPVSTPVPIMSSSIFDSFDAPPPVKPELSVPASGTMSSSIFNSFDVPPSTKSRVSVPNPGTMSSSIFDSFDVPPVSASASEAMKSSIFDSYDTTPDQKPKNSMPMSGGMESSIFDSFDTGPATKITTISSDDQSKKSNDKSLSQAEVDTNTEGLCEAGELRPPPSIWIQWRKDLIRDAAARRLIRELSTLCAPYYCDKFDEGGFGKSPMMTSEASQVLQFHCDGEELIKEVREQVEHVSKLSNLECKLVVERAIETLYSPHQFHRTFYVVLLLLANRQVELAEDVMRSAAQSLIGKCYSNAFCNNRVTNGRSCAAHFSTLVSQKLVAHSSWQLELCLWIHRGGALPLSGLALNEAVCSVRIGYFIGCQNREFKVQEMMIREPPDCLMDERAGKQLWSSLKIISGGGQRENKVVGTGSGGWEFLVDCRRARATELLRQRPTGCFIIRPHPQDHGVFTISFKTNLIPSDDTKAKDPDTSGESSGETGEQPIKPQPTAEPRPIKRDDVVQHAIIRLSDSGFRCGSFGPFGTLMNLLAAVSSSLPFDLRFDLPPTEGIIKEEGSRPSPNSAFLRKLGMQQADFSKTTKMCKPVADISRREIEEFKETEENGMYERAGSDKQRKEMFGIFFELILLHRLRNQLSAVAVAQYDSDEWLDDTLDDLDSIGSISDVSVDIGVEQEYAIASRIMRPLLTWCRMLEIEAGSFLSPTASNGSPVEYFKSTSLEGAEVGFEMSTSQKSNNFDRGDSIIRRMIQPGSGVEFRTLRLGDGGENAMVVLFSRKEAVAWFLNAGVETDEDDALCRLNSMEKNRIIESVDLQLLAPRSYTKTVKRDGDDDTTKGESLTGGDIRYRLVDPWEVEPLESREAETRGASLGRNCLLEFSLSRVTSCCEEQLKTPGELPLLDLWTALRGGMSLTKSLATVQPPWERSAGGDLLLCDGINTEPSIYENSIREHLYRNSLFERMKLPQRFVALIQVELLDLKNLTSPGGSLSLTVYSLLRLKRARSSAPMTSKARTLDSVSTAPVKLTKTSGPNAPASWGSLVRFRYPLPENTDIEGKCFDKDCESLFKGPPSVLQVSVYEKKFMSDSYLGGADIKLDGLSSGGQLEEWVPLKTETQGINWFARIRLTLRFELMCLAPKDQSSTSLEKLAPSVGRQRIQQLCSVGGAQFDLKKSVSTPDILSYFESYFETTD